MTTTKTSSSDVITNSLPSLSKLKQSHEADLKSQIKITNTLKVDVQDFVEKQAQTIQEFNALSDRRRILMEKIQDLIDQASAVETDNRECQNKVDSLDREMLEVRDEQRTLEDDYSNRMNEVRGKITGSKKNYSHEVVERRGEELREEKRGLLERCEVIEELIKMEEEEEKEEEEEEMIQGTWIDVFDVGIMRFRL